MGYNVNLYLDLEVKKDMIEYARKKLKIYVDKDDEWCVGNITITGYGEIEMDHYNIKHNDKMEGYLINIFHDCVNEGELILRGEDGEKWGYSFDGEGNVYDINFTQSKGDQIPIKETDMEIIMLKAEQEAKHENKTHKNGKHK